MPSSPAQEDTALQLVCTEVWGGNRPIDAPVELPGVRGRIYSQPCTGGRGGDIHYISVCSSGLISRLCLADVAGHGEAVATVSAEIHRLLRKYMNWFDQRTVLAKLNRRLSEIGFDALTTAATVTYFPPWRRLSVSYAGHPPAWFYSRKSDSWSRLDCDPSRRDAKKIVDLPLAADDDTTFTRRTVKVAVGDRLLLITDGILEAPDAAIQYFGGDRVGQFLDQHRHGTPEEIAAELVRAVGAYTGDPALSHDDVTLLLIEFVPDQRGWSVWRAIKNRLFRPRGNSNDPAFAAPALD